MNEAPCTRKLTGLIALAAIMLMSSGCGGGSSLSQPDLVDIAFDDLRSQVEQVIEDAERERVAVELVSRLERDYEALYDRVAERRTRVRALNADYDAPREAFVALTDQLEAEIRTARRTAGATHRELVAAMTSEEWAAVAKANTRAMKAAVDALQAI